MSNLESFDDYYLNMFLYIYIGYIVYMPHKLYASLYITIGFSIAVGFLQKQLQLFQLHLSVCQCVHENYIIYNSLS